MTQSSHSALRRLVVILLITVRLACIFWVTKNFKFEDISHVLSATDVWKASIVRVKITEKITEYSRSE
uniref:Putative secreted protein ovary overexpressed n=1 Tax=Rhipicephalus microplus TaxID=6941 RepID=A0A6M2DBW1_RHIMP